MEFPWRFLLGGRHLVSSERPLEATTAGNHREKLMKLILSLLAVLNVPAWGQNPYVVILTPELQQRHVDLITYLRAKPGFKDDIEKVYLDLKNAVNADTFPRDGNSDGLVSLDEAKRQFMRLPSNESEFGGNPAALQEAAKGRLSGWEYNYPDGRAGDDIFDINQAIKNKMQQLAGKYSEELARVARQFDDYRKHTLAHASDPQFLPRFDPNSAENRRHSKETLKKKEAEFNAAVRNKASEEKNLVQKPVAPADLLQYVWHLITTDPASEIIPLRSS
jgi:hypothetical protein